LPPGTEESISVLIPPQDLAGGAWEKPTAKAWDIHKWFLIGYFEQAPEQGIQIFFKRHKQAKIYVRRWPTNLGEVWAYLRGRRYFEDLVDLPAGTDKNPARQLFATTDNSPDDYNQLEDALVYWLNNQPSDKFEAAA
jgi:hypothetical protein